MSSTKSLTPLVVVLGATGTGKSKLAVAIAHRFHGEIINADAMQIYKGLDIMTNKISETEQLGIPHHLLGFLDPLKRFSVIEDIMSRGKIPVLVGGTHYYLESVLWKVLVDDSTDSESLVFDSFGKRNKDIEVWNAASHSTQMIEGYKLGELLDPEVFLMNKPSSELHDLLKKIDPESAMELHPNDKRKIMRSIQVFAQHGKPHSEILAGQRASEGGNSLGGALRFPDAIMIWIQCDQNVLDVRLDERVEEMMRQGLVAELRLFHDSIPKDRQLDYSKGVFQSIGLKELHKHLLIPEDVHITHNGKTLLSSAITEMKTHTRQYSRKQDQWIRNRFLKRVDRQLPNVFGLNASDASKWSDVENLAIRIIADISNGIEPVIPPLQQEESVPDKRISNHCQICRRDFVSLNQWRGDIWAYRIC